MPSPPVRLTENIMKMIRKMRSTTGYLLLSAICAAITGCANVSLPPARGYAVQVGDKQFLATSIKIHGNWIEMETESGTVWANSVVSILPKN